jgi:molybdopterin-binding protein
LKKKKQKTSINLGLGRWDHHAPAQFSWEREMKLSARNQLKGKVVSVVKGQTTAHVRVDIGGNIITSSITNEAVDDLGLAIGDEVTAIIKSSDVIIGK